MSELARLEIDGPAATLSLNRPEARNACSIELLEAAHGVVEGTDAGDDQLLGSRHLVWPGDDLGLQADLGRHVGDRAEVAHPVVEDR